jgi:uncharacterized Ntn-hydrolase superfamily protein
VTFSIVAADVSKGDWGIAVASMFPAVGAVVPYAKAGVGAVATQAWANTSFGPDGLSLMAHGVSAEEAIARLTSADDGRIERQVGMVDAAGLAATFTGEKCMEWAGGFVGEGFACQGNILAGESVVGEMVRAFESEAGDLCDRLLAALLAGDAAGGDRRGRQSAALLVVRESGGYEGRNDRYIDLRVDDDDEAPTRLARVFRTWDEIMLVRDDAALPATPELVTDLQRRLGELGVYEGPETGTFDEPTRRALERWAGERNLEGRLREDDQISALLMDKVVRASRRFDR